MINNDFLKMISSPYCAVSEPNVYKHYKRLTRWNANRCHSGAPNDRFLSNAFKLCFRLSRVVSKLYRLILGCAKKILSVRLF